MTDREPPSEASREEEAQRPRRRIGFVLGSLLTLGGLVLTWTVALKIADWQAFGMASHAMGPTLAMGDYFFVDRRAYADGRRPERGDVIAYYPPPVLLVSIRGANESTPFVHRVIGIPGDRVQLVAGVLHLNGVPLSQELIGSYRGPKAKSPGRLYREHLPSGVSYQIVKTRHEASLDNSPEFHVPPDAYFVLGDGRDEAADGRHKLSPAGPPGWYVPFSNILGRVNYVFFSDFHPFTRIGRLQN